ncbi:MAG: hypothetical protein ACM3H7_00735, partial [Acidobacteriaceae bacterium]
MGFLVSISIVITGCTVFGSSSKQVTPTSLPASPIPGLHVVSSHACQVAEQVMIRVEHSQGDLISWSPLTDSLAYIGTSSGSSWNVGDLDLLSAPLFDVPDRIATQAAGELTWSPLGTSIAYLGLRLSDNLYTVGLAYIDGRAAKDLFPGEAARTDGFSSQKSVSEWIDPDHLRVFSSCGVDCMQGLDL